MSAASRGKVTPNGRQRQSYSKASERAGMTQANMTQANMTQANISTTAPEAVMRRASVSLPSQRAFGFVLVKLASRCNIKCTYCYWFRDAQVYEKPAVLTPEAEDAFCLRLEEHIREFELPCFLLVFHGGEPLLFPKRRFDALLQKLRDIEQRRLPGHTSVRLRR